LGGRGLTPLDKGPSWSDLRVIVFTIFIAENTLTNGVVCGDRKN
jgi:hypothetical protein